MTDFSRVKTDAISQLDELGEMARLGQSSIINAGPMMLIWGSAIVVATLGEALSQRSAYTVAAWILPILLAFLASLVAIRRARQDGRTVTWRSRAIYRVWVAAGAAIVVFNVGEELRRAGIQSESEAATALILSVAVMATAELANRKALLYSGLGWMLVALGLFFAADSDAFLPLLGIAAVVLQIAPGSLLLRDEWKA
jgi:hypothetical protein